MANNNFPEITSVTSESLQLKIRSLLPSQQGFGTDLMAQNVIVPVVDLTAAAEGSQTPEFLQRALAFGSQTVFTASNSTAVVANTAGFWQILACTSLESSTGGIREVYFELSDGLSTKRIWESQVYAGANGQMLSQTVEFVVFLDSGESLSAVSNNGFAQLQGSSRQVADSSGNLIQPSGFNPQ